MNKLIFLLLVTNDAFAAGGGPTDLIAPAVNVTILASIIIYLIKDKLKLYFSEKSESTQKMIDRAATKAKEAQMMMEVQRKKIEGAEDEIKKLNDDANKFLETYEAQYKSDVDERIQKLKEDAGQKIEAEKRQLLEELNSNLLDLVISQSKEMMKKDGNLSEAATKRIIESMKS